MEVLRITTNKSHFSAQVFESAFQQCLAKNEIKIIYTELDNFLVKCIKFLGNYSQNSLLDLADDFEKKFNKYQFICPDYNYLKLIPLFLVLRNISRCPISLCLVAHSPGLYLLEWALLGKLLTNIDVIIAPTTFAKSAIVFLNQELASRIQVINHPINMVEGVKTQKIPEKSLDIKNQAINLLSLSRIAHNKLIHRQIEALYILHQQGYKNFKLKIAGDLKEKNSNNYTTYASSLLATVKSLGLENHVEFLGLVNSLTDKMTLIQNSDLLLNLSCTLEESFGKAIIEALSQGIPAIVTDWNGFPETLGKCGSYLDLQQEPITGGWDVDSKKLAHVIISTLNQPPSRHDCINHGINLSDLTKIGKSYKDTFLYLSQQTPHYPDTLKDLSDRDLQAAPQGGLLSQTAPLTMMSWGNMFSFYLDELPFVLKALQNEDSSAWEQPNKIAISPILLNGTDKLLQEFYAHKIPVNSYIQTNIINEIPDYSEDLSNLLDSAINSNSSTSLSKLACLIALNQKSLANNLNNAFPEKSLDNIAVLIFNGQETEAYQLCLSLLADLQENYYLILQCFYRLSLKLNQTEVCLNKLLNWIEKYPTHFYTFRIIIYVLELLSQPNNKLLNKTELLQECKNRFLNLVQDSSLREYVENKIILLKLSQ